MSVFSWFQLYRQFSETWRLPQVINLKQIPAIHSWRKNWHLFSVREDRGVGVWENRGGRTGDRTGDNRGWERKGLKITTVLLHSKMAVFYQSQDWNKSNYQLKMTYKQGTVILFTFSFEIHAPNIASCAPNIFSCVPKTSGSTSAPKLKFKLWALLPGN